MKVYLIEGSEGSCKIGIARNPWYRMCCLDEPLLPFSLTLIAEYDAGDAARFIETKLHKYFATKHKRGEGFYLIDSVDFLQRCDDFHKEWVPTKRAVRASEPEKSAAEIGLEDNLINERLMQHCFRLLGEEPPVSIHYYPEGV